MKKILFLVWFGFICFLLGAVTEDRRNQSALHALETVCSPYDCATDTSCEEQEQRKKEVYDKFILKQSYHM
jgi:hypothetical protein